ncbi:MAG: DPP IV N-terminal domain-containing protein [Aureibaculum sp.]|nr:DPP IV N-terminal domain-containing protein [Aureibaculum sp.]
MNSILNVRRLTVLVVVIILYSCTTTKKQEVILIDYENAAKHLGKNLNQYVYNSISRIDWKSDQVLIYQNSVKGGQEFMRVGIDTKEKSRAFDQEKLAISLSSIMDKDILAYKLPFYNFIYANDHKFIEFNIRGDDYQCNLENYSVEKIKNTKQRAKRIEFVSPNGKLAAYIDNYNLWLRDLHSGKKTQLTFDGIKDYGYATNNAGWIKNDKPVLKWSPDSKKIATFQQDARGVGEMYLTSTAVGHPTLEAWKYALPGDKIIFQIERLIIHLDPKPEIVRLKMDPDFQRSTTTDHIANRYGEFLDTEWSDDSNTLSFVSSSRDHKIAHLQMANIKTGQVASVLKEKVETYFESGVRAENWFVLKESNEVIWFSEKDNWGHLYLYDLTSKELKNQITKGEWAVQQVLNFDKEKRQIIFTAGGKEEGNPYHKYLYKVDFDGNNLINLTPEKGDHSITPSENYEYFVDTYSSTINPPISVIRNSKGEKIMDLETADISELIENGWVEPIEFSVKARDSVTDLFGLLYLPSHYDESKSYPVLNYIYPGPQSGSVGNYSFRVARRDNQALAELGFVVVAVDAMGTPGRSKSFHDAYYGNMGDNGLPDNITTIKQLALKYKGMDISRVGIWGHSGGGFASTGAILRYPEFYDVAVSSSGNHDNRNYEADWGEKWHGMLEEGQLEDKGDGTSNFDSQANQLLAENLRGKLLITHGSMDDNVPPSNTMLVVEALIKANKDFDFIMFPNQRHGYGNMTNYMTRRKWDYFVKHLKNAEPPNNFSFD